MVQHMPNGNSIDSAAHTESSLDYINFQQRSATTTSGPGSTANTTENANGVGPCPSPRPRKPKSSLTLKTWNMFGGDKSDEDEQLGVYTASNQRPAVVYSSNNFLNVSFQMKTQPLNSQIIQQQQQQQPQAQPSNQMHQLQHELLRKTLRISSASLESRSNKFGGNCLIMIILS